jgi:hypothetical protein
MERLSIWIPVVDYRTGTSIDSIWLACFSNNTRRPETAPSALMIRFTKTLSLVAMYIDRVSKDDNPHIANDTQMGQRQLRGKCLDQIRAKMTWHLIIDFNG